MLTQLRPAFYDAYRYNEWAGLSTDTKPLSNTVGYSLINGDRFYEIDTGKFYKYNADGDTWVEQPDMGGLKILNFDQQIDATVATAQTVATNYVVTRYHRQPRDNDALVLTLTDEGNDKVLYVYIAEADLWIDVGIDIDLNKYVAVFAQNFTDNEKSIARNNIGAGTSNVVVDNTLKKTGEAADAKVTGDALSNRYTKQEIDTKLEDYEKLVKLTVTMVGTQGNIPTGNTVQVYEVYPDGNEVLIGSSVYGTTPVQFKVEDGLEYKVTGTVTVSGFYVPNVQNIDMHGDTSTTVTYYEIAAPTSMSDVHNLIALGAEIQVMHIGDVINVHWTATNGNSYDVPATVADLGYEYTNHATGQKVKGVRFQFLKGFPDVPQFDKEERERATEETALANTYYYGTNDNSSFVLLPYTAGQTIDYSAYTYIYHNSFRDASFNILRYGNSLLEYSAELQWLNSMELAGNWWKSTHLGDTAPNQATTINGFMHGFSQNDFLQYVLDEDFKVGQNTVTRDGSLVTLHAKFRNPMLVEMYGSPQISGEGDNHYWELWKQLCNNSPTNPLSSPSNGECSARRIMNLENNSFSYAFCSSLNRATSCLVWGSGSGSGALGHYYAYYTFRCAPAFVIY